MSFNWINIKDRLPSDEDVKNDTRVLVISPCYKNTEMRYRLLSAQFVRICTDISHWCYVEEPAPVGSVREELE
jgi:hypothetical protein